MRPCDTGQPPEDIIEALVKPTHRKRYNVTRNKINRVPMENRTLFTVERFCVGNRIIILSTSDSTTKTTTGACHIGAFCFDAR